MPTSSSLISPPLDVRSGERPLNRQITPPLDLGLPYWFHLFFPDRALTTNLRILVIGCDDGLALRLARANPRARITAVETRADLRAAAEQTAAQQSLTNLDAVAEWPQIAAPEQGFDLVYYNQPSWPDESPQSALTTAAALLHLEGSLHITMRARYAWSGVSIVQELFERLGVQPDADGYPRARKIVAALRPDHPWNLLGPEPPLRSDELLADWLGSDEPSFTVPDLYELLAASGLRLQRFTHQPYYLPQCSPLARTPLLGELHKLPLGRQHALMELYWPGMRHHLAIACRANRPLESFQIDFGNADWLLYAPLLPVNLPVEEDESVGAQVRLCWRAAGMPELAVSLGGFQHRLLRALDRAEELAEVVGLAGLSGDPQLRDEWARDFFQMMADYDFLHFRICHSPRQPFAAPPPEQFGTRTPGRRPLEPLGPGPNTSRPETSAPEQPANTWAQLAHLSQAQHRAEPTGESAEIETVLELPETPLDEDLDLEPAAPFTSETGLEIPPQLPDQHPEPLPVVEASEDPAKQETDRLALMPPAIEPPRIWQPRETTAAEHRPTKWPRIQATRDQHPLAADEPPTAPAASPTAEPPLMLPDRIPYEACPLCAGFGSEPLRQAPAELAVAGRLLRAAMPWVRCRSCAHIFTSGYFAGDAWMPILQETMRWRRNLRIAVKKRGEASRVVSTITALRESATGRWLDVGCSNNGLVAVAAEFGYAAIGVDCCHDAAQLFAELGYTVTAGSLFDCQDGPFDVISVSGVVENMPFPAQGLSHVHRLLAPRGLVYVSAATTDSLLWKKLDSEGVNPYWSRLNRYHAFRRKSLFQLLRNAGLEPCSYGACGTDGVGMEVIACKT